MEILFTKKALARLAVLPAGDQARMLGQLERLKTQWGRPHLHSGVRTLQRGCIEVRCGIHIRAVLISDPPDMILHLIGNHEDIQRFLRKL